MIRRVLPFLIVLALLPAVAGQAELPFQRPGCQAPDCAAPGPNTKHVDSALPADKPPPKPDLLDHVAAFFAQAGDAIGGASAAVASATSAAAGAVGRFFASVGAAIAGAVAAAAVLLTEFLLRFRPAGWPLPAYAAAAAGATAVTSAGAQVGAWYAWKKLAPWAALLPGFSRIAKDELLDHDRRNAIFEMIRHNPGIRMAELSRGLDLPWSSCLHHLRKLRTDRLITFKSVGAHKCFFVNGSGLSEQQMQTASLVKGATLQQIAAFVQAHPGTTLKDLAAGTGVSSPLAAFHVAKLARAGLLTKTRDGRATRLAYIGAPPGPASGVGSSTVVPMGAAA